MDWDELQYRLLRYCYSQNITFRFKSVLQHEDYDSDRVWGVATCNHIEIRLGLTKPDVNRVLLHEIGHVKLEHTYGWPFGRPQDETVRKVWNLLRESQAEQVPRIVLTTLGMCYDGDPPLICRKAEQVAGEILQFVRTGPPSIHG